MRRPSALPACLPASGYDVGPRQESGGAGRLWRLPARERPGQSRHGGGNGTEVGPRGASAHAGVVAIAANGDVDGRAHLRARGQSLRDGEQGSARSPAALATSGPGVEAAGASKSFKLGHRGDMRRLRCTRRLRSAAPTLCTGWLLKAWMTSASACLPLSTAT